MGQKKYNNKKTTQKQNHKHKNKFVIKIQILNQNEKKNWSIIFIVYAKEWCKFNFNRKNKYIIQGLGSSAVIK